LRSKIRPPGSQRKFGRRTGLQSGWACVVAPVPGWRAGRRSPRGRKTGAMRRRRTESAASFRVRRPGRRGGAWGPRGWPLGSRRRVGNGQDAGMAAFTPGSPPRRVVR